MHFLIAVVLVLAYLVPASSSERGQEAPASLYARWKNGPPTTPNYFPIAVWLQNPRNATRYKSAGINLYVGLWRGPTAEQLHQLENAGMELVCAQNPFALQQRDNKTIIGWMHGDEPDNAQSLGSGKGYGPPIKPEVIQRDYEKLRAADPTRPVLLNLGQGVAYDQYIGRGVRRNHPEDYPEYIKGSDIVSFDIYPVVHEKPEVAGKLEYVARGVERLGRWSSANQVVWNCIECTHISNPERKATSALVRAEVWMALVHGSRGLIYFVHEFKPSFREAALLDDAELLPAVTAINKQIHGLAPVLNTASVSNEVSVSVPPGQTPPAFAVKRHQGNMYLFTVGMSNQSVKAAFKFSSPTRNQAAEVLEEGRKVEVKEGVLADEFAPYQVHLYRLAEK